MFNLCNELLENIEIKNLQDRCDMYETILTNLISSEVLVEGMLDSHNGPLEAELDEVMKRLMAAKRGLQLANKLPPGEGKSLNKSRVMTNLNKIRVMFKSIVKRLELDQDTINSMTAIPKDTRTAPVSDYT